MLEDTGERIQKLRKLKGWTLEQLGNAVGVNKSTVRKWETGFIKNMRRDKLAAVAAALNTTPEYLMGWSDDPAVYDWDWYEKEQAPTVLTSPALPGITMGACCAAVPLFTGLSCGKGGYIGETPDDFLGIPKGLLNEHSLYFSNPAEGDSMEPRIHRGDLIIFEQADTIENGQIGAFSLNGEYYCKRFKRYPDGSAWLISENSDYAPIPVRESDDFRVIGVYKYRLTAN